ncbi:MAG TPA: hypothetical protein VED01_04735 [Burkholderiales bacterium]|nr:hypothetical protein [Burkholderiales bacterium]
MISRDDLQALRIPLIAFAATVVVSITLIVLSGSFLDRADRAKAQREAQLREARGRIQNAGEEKEMIGRYLAGYQQLARAGFVGEEQRINWLDSLRLANEEARIFGVEYDIGAQKPYAYAAEFNPGQLALQESVMNLRLRLLHEEDLPRFFNALARYGGGLFTIDQCSLRREARAETDRSLNVQPNLNAECNVRWLTVKPQAAAEKKG